MSAQIRYTINKKVSIIISAYNAGNYLHKTLDSVLNQTWSNMEVIVVNDGSIDNTLHIANTFKTRGVVVLSQENKGQDAALNNGFAHSTGEYIKFMDSDDLINADMIEIQMQKLNGGVDYVAYGEWARFYNDFPQHADFTPLNYWQDMSPMDFLTSRPEGVMLQCGIMLIPRVLIEKAGLWDERLILYNDTEFFNRVLLQSHGVKFTKGARLFYRSAMSGSISAQTARRFFESTFLATNLIAEQLLAVEDSYRVRNLITNTYLNQYYRMYPRYADLAVAHKRKIKYYGNGTEKPQGGKVYNFLAGITGWKFAKIVQFLFYSAGYKPVQKENT